MMPHDIHITDFVRRQTQNSQYSHWILTDQDLLDRIESSWDKQKPGYRDGVILVPVDPQGFYTSIVVLNEGDKLAGQYLKRSPNEEPRKSVVKDRGNATLPELKRPAASCVVVLYRNDVLAEDGDQTGHEWNVISVNANHTDEEVPIHPDTLIANHFHLSGGTYTGWSAERFEHELRRSVLYWRDKAMVG